MYSCTPIGPYVQNVIAESLLKNTLTFTFGDSNFTTRRARRNRDQDIPVTSATMMRPIRYLGKEHGVHDGGKYRHKEREFQRKVQECDTIVRRLRQIGNRGVVTTAAPPRQT